MKYLLTALIVMEILAPRGAFADNSYFVELGQDASPDAASSQWQALVKKHKTLLGGLKYFPKTVMNDLDHEGANTRIQAGPIETKDKAQKICTVMFHNSVSCFVIEGVGNTPPTKVINLSTASHAKPVKMLQLPWLINSGVASSPIAQAPVTTTETESSIPDYAAPRFVEAPSQEKLIAHENVEPQPEINEPQAEVHVAEAIRVPLTHDESEQQNTKVVVGDLPNLKPSFELMHNGQSKYADESTESGPGWLTLQTFASEDIATSFWEEVRNSSKEAKKLRVRTLRPLLGNGQASTSLNIGPFSNSSEAYNFCRTSVQASERGLTCRFAVNDSKNAGDAAPRRYPTENPVTYDVSGNSHATSDRKYWIQVASASSQAEALSSWEDIKSENDDIVHGMRNSVSVSTQDKTYVVRLGPIDDHDNAIHACSQMQQRGVECKVIMYFGRKN